MDKNIQERVKQDTFDINSFYKQILIYIYIQLNQHKDFRKKKSLKPKPHEIIQLTESHDP